MSGSGAPEPGSFVGEYVAGRPIGDRGGMATVFLAYEPTLDRAVALKRLDVDACAGALLAEARLTCSLAHPNVVAVHDYLVADGTPYMAMEYLRRGSLRRHVGRLGLAQWLRVLEALLSGLQHAHERGIVHCDIKPENLLIDNAGTVKIADFGVARSALASADGAAPSGTPLYMAPEQALGQAPTAQTDLYATGVVAYELLLGRPPLPHSAIAPGLAPELVEWLEWLLAPAPADRPRSAREAWERLEELAVGMLGPLWRRDAGLGSPHDDADPAASTPTLAAAVASAGGASTPPLAAQVACAGAASTPTLAAQRA
jgi:serine/threonine protein kinase